MSWGKWPDEDRNRILGQRPSFDLGRSNVIIALAAMSVALMLVAALQCGSVSALGYGQEVAYEGNFEATCQASHRWHRPGYYINRLQQDQLSDWDHFFWFVSSEHEICEVGQTYFFDYSRITPW